VEWLQTTGRWGRGATPPAPSGQALRWATYSRRPTLSVNARMT
jgi:hypothetical protein